MAQTSYDQQAAGFPGLQADNGPIDSISRMNGSSAALPFGVLVKQDGSVDTDCDAFSAGADPLGVLLHTHAYANRELAGANGVAIGDEACVMRKGRIYVTVEDAVDAGAQAYARHTSDGGSNTQKGSFRSDVDGVAQVTTVTPSIQNSTAYSLNVFVDGKLFFFAASTDGSGDATELCDLFRTAMAANAEFTALVVATGTTTLILTGQTEGEAFQVVSGGSAGTFTSITTGTAASARAEAVPGCRYLTSADAGDLAVLEVNLPQ